MRVGEGPRYDTYTSSNSRGNIDSIKKITDTLIDAGKVIGLEVNAEKTKHRCMLLPRRDAGQNRHLKKLTYLLKMLHS
jgi:hypothetical protein